jgi:hypothetical protein
MLCVSIHIYYIPIAVILMLATFIAEFMKDKSEYKYMIITFIVSTAVGVLLIYFLGGFTNNNYSNDGMNYYNANLNIFLNPQGYSTFLPRLACATDGEYEAFRIFRFWNNFTIFISDNINIYKKRL